MLRFLRILNCEFQNSYLNAFKTLNQSSVSSHFLVSAVKSFFKIPLYTLPRGKLFLSWGY